MWLVIGEPPRWTSRMPPQQLVRRRPLEQVAGGPGGERVEDQVGVLVDRQHHDLHVPAASVLQPAHALDAAHAGQVDVHEHDVGPDGGQLGDRPFAALVLAHAGEPVGAVDEAGDAGAHARVVLDDRDTDRLALAGGGCVSHGRQRTTRAARRRVASSGDLRDSSSRSAPRAGRACRRRARWRSCSGRRWRRAARAGCRDRGRRGAIGLSGRCVGAGREAPAVVLDRRARSRRACSTRRSRTIARLRVLDDVVQRFLHRQEQVVADVGAELVAAAGAPARRGAAGCRPASGTPARTGRCR